MQVLDKENRYPDGWRFCFAQIGGGVMAARLTDKQRQFINEYLIDLNATQAAIRAGYSRKTADRIGPELLGKTCVSKAIREAKAERQERTEITQDYVLLKLKEIADKTASDAQDSDLKYSNKIKALELLGKHVGVFDGKEKPEPDSYGKQALADMLRAPKPNRDIKDFEDG